MRLCSLAAHKVWFYCKAVLLCVLPCMVLPSHSRDRVYPTNSCNITQAIEEGTDIWIEGQATFDNQVSDVMNRSIFRCSLMLIACRTLMMVKIKNRLSEYR